VTPIQQGNATLLVLAAGLFLEVAGVLIVLGMLIKTVKLLETANKVTNRRVSRLARRFVNHQLDRTVHPDVPKLQEEIDHANATAQAALLASRGGSRGQ
jgi:hypothetical protein